MKSSVSALHSQIPGPTPVRSIDYGRSGEGRPLRATDRIAQRRAVRQNNCARRGIPILMIQGGIHPGESDGKDAGFIALRELLSTATLLDDPLARIAVLFVPSFNADGHERVRPLESPESKRSAGHRLAYHRTKI